MAKLTKKYSFKNGEISKEEGKYILTEINKDSSEEFDLSAILDDMIGISGISMSFGSDDEVPSI